MGRLRWILVVYAAVLPFFWIASANAAPLFFRARLDVTPNVTTLAYGGAFFAYDTTTRVLTSTLDFHNISGEFLGAQIYGAGGSVGFGASAGPFTEAITMSPQWEAGLLAGELYVRVRSAAYTAGEIAGRIRPIDTRVYGVSNSSSANSIGGRLTFDPSTMQLSWEIHRYLYRMSVTETEFHAPVHPTVMYAAPRVMSVGTSGFGPDVGSATLTAVQAAQIVNGLWYYDVHNFGPYASARILPRYPRFLGMATRLPVGTADDVAIAGFVIDGNGPKRVVILAKGPSLRNAGVAQALADPKLVLVRSSDGATLAENDSWQSDPYARAELQFSGLDALEAASLLYLQPGAYTAIVSGADGGSGIALVEVYELGQPENELLGIATRGQVRDVDEVMIAGFTITGEVSKTVAIVAAGPSLEASGVRGTLADPLLTLVRASDQTIIGQNDDWGTAPNAAALQAAGFAPRFATESAILVTLPPGAYTAIVSGAPGTTGVALVSVYAVD